MNKLIILLIIFCIVFVVVSYAQNTSLPMSWQEFLEYIQEQPESKRKKITKRWVKSKPSLPYVKKNKITFVYCGKGEEVKLAGDFNGWKPVTEMQPIANANVWYCTLEFPSDARFEYKFVVDNNWILDSHNAKTDQGGFGFNSDAWMPEYQAPEWLQMQAQHRGKIETFTLASEILKNTRNVYVYTPHGYQNQKKYPVLVVHDGKDYIHLAKLPQLVDLLIEQNKISPIVMVFVDPVNRTPEYGCSKDYLKFTSQELLPFVENKYAISQNPAERVFAGASMGGIVSFFLAYSVDSFSGAICQSGAFIFKDMISTEDDSKVENFMDKIDYSNAKELKIWLDCGNIGQLEKFLLEGNRKLHKNLEEHSIPHHYEEINEAHNWGSWRNRMHGALLYCFGK